MFEKTKRTRAVHFFIPQLLVLLAFCGQALAQAIPQKNVNAIGPTPLNWLYAGNPRMQQNEPECAVSPNNPEWLACGFNDYRAVNFLPIGDAFPGIAMSRDLGKTWISGLTPQHLADIPNIGQKFGADANLEALPNLLLYNFIAGWRDDSQPGGVYVSRWYEHNREIGPPWEYLDTIQIDVGTSGRFLDKPAFDVALRLGMPDIQIPIPAFNDPRNLDNSHAAYTLHVPAARAHICYAVFVGNDNNNGTKINCLASDDGGATWPIKTKLTEGVEINQGVSLATKNQEVVAVWRRFSDNNETSAIMFAKSHDEGNTWGKAEVLTEFCAFDQTTGAARFRTNALPVVVNSGNEFAVYFASRNDATKTCVSPAKGKKPAVPHMSPVALADDFDSFDEPDPVAGVRSKDGQVRTALNFARIMMVRGSGDSARSWSPPVAIDPQEYEGAVNGDGSPIPVGARKPSHQFMPAVEAAGGIETVAWYDSRLDKLITRSNPIAGGFVEDLVLHFEPVDGATNPTNPNTWQSVSLLPAGVYDIVPPPATLPPNVNNIPLRRNIDVFAAQIDGDTGLPREYSLDADFYPAANPTDIVPPASPSTRVTRFPTRRSATGPKQAEWNYPNGRLFRKGKSSFIGDYNSVAAAQFRQLENGTWIPNQAAPVDGVDLFPSLEPMFHVGWTSNRNVRGKVYYTGCDRWDEALQMWVTNSAGCDSSYTDPIAPRDVRLAPLQGEDGGADGPPLVCVPGSPGQNFPLTRNQNIFVAAMKPGFSANVLSAVKRPVGSVNTFVLGLENGSSFDRFVVLELPDNVLSGVDRMSLDRGAPDLSITVKVPRGSSNTRTVFDFGNDEDELQDTVVLTVRDCPGFDPLTDLECAAPDGVLARVPLLRSSLTPLENVQNKLPCDSTVTDPTDPNFCVDPINLIGEGEFYDLILQREQTLSSPQLLDLENLDLENTVQMLDLENLDLENLDLENLDLENLDLENLDLENLDLENVLLFLDLENLDLENLDLENALYEQLDLENLDLENDGLLYLDLENLDLENTFLQFLDLENLDLENLDLENLDLENLDLENLDLENLDLENLDLENLDLENQSFLALDLENLDLENLDLENTAPGDTYTEISWTADSATNTTTGVDVKPIFSPSLAEDLTTPGTNFKVLLTVRQPYMTSTVVNNEANFQYCAPQVVVENQLLYAAVLDANQINSLIGDPDPNNPNTPSFVAGSDQSTIITLRFINPPVDQDFLNTNTGMAIYAQPGGVDCESELGGAEVENVCEIDFIQDTTAPVIMLNGAATMELEAGFDTYVEPGATANDDFDGDLTSAIVKVGDVDATVPGTYAVTYNVSDAAGNPADTKTRTVIVEDTTAPTIDSVPAPINLEANDSSGYLGSADLWATVTATDLLDGSIDAVCTPGPATDFGFGGKTVSCVATDAAGNDSAPATFTVTVADTIAPTINLATVPLSPVVVEANDATGWVYAVPLLPLWSTITASDIVDSTVNAVCLPSAIDNFITGDTIVTCDATDNAGNISASVSFTVSVEDTTGPMISGLNPPTFDSEKPFILASDQNSFQLAWGPFDVDDTDPNPVVSCSVGVLDLTRPLYTFVYSFPVGTTTVTCTATDSAGNTESGTFEVTILDETAPIITLDGDNPMIVEASNVYVEPGVLSVFDNVDADLIGNVVIDSSSVNTALPGNYSVSYSVTDSSGNSTTVNRAVNVVDTTAPVITAPADVTAEATGAQTSVGIGTATATDAVGVTSISSDAPATFPVGTTTVTWTASDAAGNESTATQTVTVQDTTAPAITAPANVLEEASAPQTAVTTGTATATDAVGVTSISSDAPATFPVGTTTVTWTASDAAGNVSTATQTVTIQDTTAPAITVPADVSAEATGTATTVAIGTATATDAVGPVTITSNAPASYPVGTTTVTWTAADANGNSSTADQIVTVVDSTAPIITPPADITVDTAGVVAEIVIGTATATDAVGPVTITNDAPVTMIYPLGVTTVTWTATDGHGNSSTATQAITVNFLYDFFFDLPKGKLQAGSTLPVDFYYEDGGTRVDASAFTPSASWLGPFDAPGCAAGGPAGSESGNDSGFSSFRWSSSLNIWQYSWQTPSLTGSYFFTISPPGTSGSTTPVCLK
jgi:uncharacterized protein YjbI with pentapeptide repeats